jgi:malonate-semialdehyde dehydrogenase (acetylating) / methylmalonate-semialdehyde dehydrogenase
VTVGPSDPPTLPRNPERLPHTMKTITHWIGGKPVEGTSGRYSPVYNPATGAQEKQLPLASVEEVDAAVAAAKQAYDGG